jgi:hypothetical protein
VRPPPVTPKSPAGTLFSKSGSRKFVLNGWTGEATEDGGDGALAQTAFDTADGDEADPPLYHDIGADPSLMAANPAYEYAATGNELHNYDTPPDHAAARQADYEVPVVGRVRKPVNVLDYEQANEEQGCYQDVDAAPAATSTQYDSTLCYEPAHYTAADGPTIPFYSTASSGPEHYSAVDAESEAQYAPVVRQQTYHTAMPLPSRTKPAAAASGSYIDLGQPDYSLASSGNTDEKHYAVLDAKEPAQSHRNLGSTAEADASTLA